jgi:glycerol-3-phosphate dehydrogenase
MSNVAEGIDTTVAVHYLANNLQCKASIINLVYSVLFESLPPAEIIDRFRDGLKPETEV